MSTAVGFVGDAAMPSYGATKGFPAAQAEADVDRMLAAMAGAVEDVKRIQDVRR